jgi:hypothetical protein
VTKVFKAEESGGNLSPFMQAAPDLVALGFHVVPLAEKKKYPGEYTRGEWRPQTEWQRFRDRKPTEFEWQVWKTWPNANVGIVTGSKVGDYQIVAIDIDTNDPDEVDEILGCLPRSPMAKKGQKGLTLFYRGDARLRTRKYDRNGRESLCEILTGQDTRQTVVPPSIHPITDTAYFWTRGPVPAEDLPTLSPDDVEVLEETLQGLGWNEFDTHQPRRAEFIATGKAEWLDTPFAELNRDALQNLDKWVHDLDLYDLKKARRGYEAVNTWRESSTGQPLSKRKRNLSIQPSGIADWGSNERFSPIDLVMTAKGFGFDDAFVWLHTAIYGEAPPIVLRAKQSSEYVDPGISENDQVLVPIFEEFSCDAPLPIWRELPDVWLLRRIAEWICEGASKALPVLAIGAALSVLSAAIGRQYLTPKEGTTNLFLLSLADSGAGKNRPLDAALRLMRSADLENLIGPSTWTAASVLENQLAACPNILCVTDEFADTLGKMTARNTTMAEQSKLRLFKELFSIGQQTYKTQAMAQRASENISSPHLSVFAAATPGLFYRTLRQELIEGGFFNRWLVLFDRPEIDKALEDQALRREAAFMMGEEGSRSPNEVPADIVAGIRRLHTRRDDGSHPLPASLAATSPNFKIEPEKVVMSEEAVALYFRYSKWCADIVPQIAEDVQNFYVRAAEIALRIATILSVAQRANPEMESGRICISLEDMSWSLRFVDWSVRRSIAEANERMFAGPYADIYERIIKFMGKHKGQWVPRSKLIRHFTKQLPNPRDRQVVLEALVEMGDLEVREQNSRSDGRGGLT